MRKCGPPQGLAHCPLSALETFLRAATSGRNRRLCNLYFRAVLTAIQGYVAKRLEMISVSSLRSVWYKSEASGPKPTFQGTL